MCVSRGARNAVTPCRSRIIAVYQRSGLYRYMQTCRVRQIWKDELDVMGFRAWRETPGLRRRQRQQRLQFTPGFATILGSIHRTQFCSRVERARLRGCKRHYVRLSEILQWMPGRSPIAGSQHSIAECSAVNNARTSSVSGNALDPLVVQTDLPDPAFTAAL